jgi:hypothetical protein
MMTHIRKVQLADPCEQEDLPIEILVRGDHYWKIVYDSPSWHMSPSIVLLHSRFGCILSGNRSVISVNVAAVNLLNSERPGPLPGTEIKRGWEVETIGVKANQDK